MAVQAIPTTAPMKRVQGLVLAAHPGPSLVVSAVAVILGVAIGLDVARTTLLGLSVLTGQLSIGWSNDWMDAARDRVLERQDKPIVTGLVSAGTVRAGAFVALATTIILAFVLGVATGITQLIFVGSAWSYNAGLKSTPWSWLPYALSFGLLPLLASFALPSPAWALPWVIAAGALLGVAAHFANVLPDFSGDRQTGVQGLPHRLGAQISGVIPFLLLVAVAALVTAEGFINVGSGTASATGGPPTLATIRLLLWLPWIGLAMSIAIALLGIIIVRTRSATRTLMRLIMLSALVDVAMLAMTGAAMVGTPL